MNEIIQKVVDELAKDAPKLDYIRGMLETVLVMNQQPVENRLVGRTPAFEAVNTGSIPVSPATEADMLDAQARAAIEKVQALAAVQE